MSADRTATLYRMVLPEETCPFGLKAKALLEQSGYRIEDHLLRSRGEVEAFEAKHNVETTPLVFIDGEQIGGADDLEDWLAAHA